MGERAAFLSQGRGSPLVINTEIGQVPVRLDRDLGVEVETSRKG